MPDAKLIYLVREPVARIESECMQALKYERYVLGEHALANRLAGHAAEPPTLIGDAEKALQVERQGSEGAKTTITAAQALRIGRVEV